jgi:hypothetical protein
VTVQVAARSDSGVRSLSLGGGGQTFAPAPGAAGPVYEIAVDTTKLSDGNVSLTATVTPGASAQPVSSTAFALTVDNTPPVLTVGTVANAQARIGTVISLDVTANEVVASIIGAVSSPGAGAATEFTEVRAPDANVHHFAYAVTASNAAGLRTVEFRAVDRAGNPSAPKNGAFAVHSPIAVTTADMTANGAATVGSLPAVRQGSTLTAMFRIPDSVEIADGVKPTFTLTDGEGASRQFQPTTAALVAGGFRTWTVATPINPSPADAAGTATLTASIADVAGNPATLSKTVLIDKTQPLLAGIAINAANVHASDMITITGVASELLKSATFSAGSQSGDCTCNLADCAAATASPPTVTCSFPVSSGPGSVTATVALSDLVGNTSPGGATFQKTFQVVALPIIDDLTRGAAIITKGTSTTITPKFTGGTGAVTATPPGSGLVTATTDVPITVSPSVSTLYTLNVTDAAGGSATPARSVQIDVVDPPVITSFRANNTTVTVDDPIVFSYSTTGVSGNVTISDGTPPPAEFSSGTDAVTINAPSSPGSITYTLDIQNGATSPAHATAIVAVTVVAAPEVSTPLAATPNAVLHGESFSLTATVAGGTAVIRDQFGTVVQHSGTGTITAMVSAGIQADTTYTVTLTNAAGATTTSSVLVTVSPGSFTATTGALSAPRFGHTATLLLNGNVLIAGGGTDPAGSSPAGTAVVYDPSLGTFTPITGVMKNARAFHTATLLSDGRALLCGGVSGGTSVDERTCDLYDPEAPSATAFSDAAEMPTQRLRHTATVLSNGTVLLAGGDTATGTVNTKFVIYTPAAGAAGSFGGDQAWTTARRNHTATPLANGNVLIAGGHNGTDTVNTGEIFSGTAFGTAPTGTLGDARQLHTATKLASGKVLIAGGNTTGTTATNTAVLYDPVTNAFSGAGVVLGTARYNHVALLLGDGKVLFAGGQDGATPTVFASSEVYTGTAFALRPSMSVSRRVFTATVVFGGTVHLIGGSSNSSPDGKKGEVFDPFN